MVGRILNFPKGKYFTNDAYKKIEATPKSSLILKVREGIPDNAPKKKIERTLHFRDKPIILSSIRSFFGITNIKYKLRMISRIVSTLK